MRGIRVQTRPENICTSCNYRISYNGNLNATSAANEFLRWLALTFKVWNLFAVFDISNFIENCIGMEAECFFNIPS